MTCKECFHFEVCMDKFKKQYSMYANKDITIDDCEHFKNKADFVEVVRCEKCEHQDQCCEFVSISGDFKDIDFCSYGERVVNYESSKTEQK